MTTELQRIRIAEACGWTKCQKRNGHITGVQPGDDEFDGLRGLPDFLNDLNAMAEAEKTLGNASLDFDKHLKDVVFSGCRVASFDSYPGDFIWHATAAQRAEALLKAIGKWTV